MTLTRKAHVTLRSLRDGTARSSLMQIFVDGKQIGHSRPPDEPDGK